MYEHKNTKYALNIISVIKIFHNGEQLDLHYAMFKLLLLYLTPILYSYINFSDLYSEGLFLNEVTGCSH